MVMNSITRSLKRFIKRVLPNPILKARVDYITRRNRVRMAGQFDGLSTKDVFGKIYSDGLWGATDGNEGKFYSGSGSHDPEIVKPYIEAVRAFLARLPHKPDLVDLGCGDFAVGSRLRDLCNRYVACDVVDALIAFNKEKYKDQDVDFRVLDFTSQEIPNGSIVVIRQVLQHLSNEQILRAVRKLELKYNYLILTEHLPSRMNFVANRDKPAGPDTRLNLDGEASGVVLTAAPFELRAKSERILCERFEFGGVVRTILYELAN